MMMNDKQEFFHECCDNFRIREADLVECKRSLEDEHNLRPKKKKQQDVIDYDKYLSEYFNLEKPLTKMKKKLENNDLT